MENEPKPITKTDVARVFRDVYGASRWTATEYEFALAIANLRDSQWKAELEKKNVE